MCNLLWTINIQFFNYELHSISPVPHSNFLWPENHRPTVNVETPTVISAWIRGIPNISILPLGGGPSVISSNHNITIKLYAAVS